MRNLLTIALIIVGITTSVANDRYLKEMTSAIENIYSMSTAEECTSIIQKLERISQVETGKWEPKYYAAYAYVELSQMKEEPAEKDSYLDKALKLVKEGLAIAPNEAELHVLQGYVHTMQLVIDPMSRGAQYSGMAFAAYNKALELDDSNPRAWFMFGSMQLGTARFMGSGTDEACQSLKKALEKFDSYDSSNPLSPKWGKGGLLKTLEACNQE